MRWGGANQNSVSSRNFAIHLFFLSVVDITHYFSLHLFSGIDERRRRRKPSEESSFAQWAISRRWERRQRNGERGLCGVAKWAIVPPMGAGVDEKAIEDGSWRRRKGYRGLCGVAK